MTTDEAIAFLEAHQPMPPDDKGTQEEIDDWIEAFNHAMQLEPPDPRFISLFLNSFPKRMEIGAYQEVESLLARYDASLVVPPLINALESKNPSIQSFAAEFSRYFPDPRLTSPLIATLKFGFAESRAFAAMALAFHPGALVDQALAEALRRERDRDVRGSIEDTIAERLGIEF